jgi:ribosome maturation factor RimP
VSRNPLHQRLIAIVEPVCKAAGYDLFDLRFVLEQGGWTLRVAVDTPLDEHTDPDEVPSERVDLLACENLSRELSAVLDVEDPIPQAFNLEVSSPGIDRPLRTLEHFRHFTGSEAKIQLAAPAHLPSGERRNFKGILRGIEDNQVVIECDGTAFRLPLDDIDHAKLVPDWDAVMKGKSGVGKPTSRPIKPGHRPSQKRKPEPARSADERSPRQHDPQGAPRQHDPQSEPLEVDPGDPRDAKRGGVNGPARPVQQPADGNIRPLSIHNKER